MSEPTTRFVVGKREGGRRLDQFLHQRIPGLSRTRIQQAIRERVVLSWGVDARPSTPVRSGGVIEIGHTPLEEELIELEIPVLQRGPGWLAVDKPPGIPVHPVNRVRENTLIRMLRRQEGSDSLRLCHRLDRETSGVLLIAGDVPTSSHLSSAFMNGQVGKQYLALVRGVVAQESGSIALPVGKHPTSTIYTKQGTADGQPARTDWKVEQRRCDTTLLRLFPSTGRRHQIRVHLEAIGHPILGDLLYGRPDEHYLRLVRGEGDARADGPGPARQLLHCARLVFPCPTGEGEIEVSAPLPADFEIGS